MYYLDPTKSISQIAQENFHILSLESLIDLCLEICNINLGKMINPITHQTLLIKSGESKESQFIVNQFIKKKTIKECVDKALKKDKSPFKSSNEIIKEIFKLLSQKILEIAD